MTGKTALSYRTKIAAPRAVVWDTMLGPETYPRWTAPFCDGSTYEGSWEEGTRIRHLGEIRDGEEDTTSEAVRAWAPAYENYRFADASGGGTVVEIEVETLPDYVDFLDQTYPRALAVLKEICEASPDGR